MDDQTNGLESRRSVIRKLGAGAGAATLGLGATGSATANESNPVFPDTNFVEETGSAKDRAIQAAVESDDYTTISNELFNMGWEIGDHSDAKVVRVETPENDTRQVVGFELRKAKTSRRRTRRTRRSSSDYPSGSVSFSLIDHEVVSARSMFSKKEWTGSKTVSSQMNTEFPGNKLSASTKTIKYDEDSTTVTRETQEIDVNKIDLSVSGQKSDACWACVQIGNAVCTTGCGTVATATICGSLGLASGGALGYGCAALMALLCTILTTASEYGLAYACNTDLAIEYACAQKNICDGSVYTEPRWDHTNPN